MTDTHVLFGRDSPSLTALLVTICVLMVTTWYLVRRRIQTSPPGPHYWQTPWILCGYGKLQVSRLERWARKYGDVFRISVGRKQVVVLSSVEVVRECFVKHESTFSCRPSSWIFNRLNNGLALSTRFYDKTWKRQRAFTTFIHRNLRAEKTNRLQNVLDDEVSRFVTHLYHLQGAPFKPRLLLLKAIANVFCEILFCRTFEYDSDRLEWLAEKLNYLDFQVSDNNDIFTYLPFAWYLLPGRRKRLQTIYCHLLEVFADIIEEDMKTYTQGNIRHVLDVYIQEAKKEAIGERSIFEGDVSPADSLKHTVLEYFYTGVVTLAKTMETVFMQIIERPDIQSRIRHEISSVRMLNGHRPPTIEDINNSCFSYATILEVLRLYPVEPLSWPRYSVHDAEIGGYTIRKGTVVLANIHAIHRDPRYWDKPLEFDPERFIVKSNERIQLNEYFAFIPWSIGPRKCVGEVLSRLVLWSFFASVMQKFQLTTPRDRNGNQSRDKNGNQSRDMNVNQSRDRNANQSHDRNGNKKLINEFKLDAAQNTKMEEIEICAVDTIKLLNTDKPYNKYKHIHRKEY